MKYLLVVALSVLAPLNGGWAEQTLGKLSLREKIGQLCIVATASDFSEENSALARRFGLDIEAMKPTAIGKLIQEYAIGGLIFQLSSTSEKQIALTNQYQSLSNIPLLICQDAENGLRKRHTDALRFPSNMTLGAIQDEQLIYQMALEVGRQCKAIGVHMNFAPVVDVNNNPANPVINDRSFGEDKKRVARLGELFSKGLQTAGVIPCAKHFPGHGDTDIDSHLSLPTITHDKKRLASVELYPFKYLIQRGVPAIMNAHLSIPAYDAPGVPSSLSYR